MEYTRRGWTCRDVLLGKTRANRTNRNMGCVRRRLYVRAMQDVARGGDNHSGRVDAGQEFGGIIMILNEFERERFVKYCRTTSESCGLIADQLKGIGMPDAKAVKERMKQAAYAIVADDLDRVENQEIT